jgi:hypothetical protein
MKLAELQALTVAELVTRFGAIAIDQDKAIFDDNNRKYNRLFDQMQAVKDELKSRGGDQRRALVTLLEHPNFQVRLQAARATLAVAPEQSRRVIEAIAASRHFPQAGDAGMCLWALDQGIFVPK